MILDVTATLESRQRSPTRSAPCEEISIPLAVGGGIRSLDDAEAAIEAGADKVSVNSAALADPTLITRLAARYGSQAIVVAIDAKRANGRFAVYSRSGSTAADREAVEWAQEAERSGAGEILLTSIDRTAPRRLRLRATAAVSTLSRSSRIGRSRTSDFSTVHHRPLRRGAGRLVFHYSEHAVSERSSPVRKGVPIR